MSSIPPVAAVAIVGPTASGKTRLAIEVAERLGSEIISADSMQVYRGMAIGTAAATAAEQGRIRHHFVGIAEPGEEVSAGRFGREAGAVLEQIAARGVPALVAGGSGLYLQALLDGLFDGPPRDETIRARLQAAAEAHGAARLFARLSKVDPDYAASLTSKNDLVRIVRALEVFEITGAPFSALHRSHQAAPRVRTPALRIGLDWDRDALYRRIDARVDAMIAGGWLDEVRSLINAGHREAVARVKALGYRELLAHLDGSQSLEEAVSATKQHHRRLAKRQLTWFRADDRIGWKAVSEATDAGALADAIVAHVHEEAGSC